jgi:hypothetical protein
MKKIIFFLLLSGWILAGSAQDKEPARPDPINVIKFMPFNLAFNSVSFEYEGMVNDHNSMTLEVGIPNHRSYNTDYNVKFLSNVVNAELGTMSLKLAYRHYSGGQKLVPAGFYFEPYIKYQNLKGNGFYIGSDVPYQSNIGKADLKLNTFNLGFQLGAQFLVGKRIAIDFYFFGLEAGLASGDMYVISHDAAAIADDINKAIADLPSYYQHNLTVTESQYKVNVNAKNVLYPWYRAGINIGIAF